MTRFVPAVVFVWAVLALGASAAVAAVEPVVSTGNATAITPTSATLNGTVNPEGAETSYVFQYGTSTAYGSQTPTTSAGSESKTISVSSAIGPLTPNTTYHFRLAATSSNGTALGRDVSFKTSRSPAGVTIAALPGTITFGQLTGLSGRVLPPRPAHVIVTLQTSPGGGGPWTDAAITTAGSTGAYSFAGLAPSANTYYRVLSDGVTSGAVLVSVRFRVGLRVSRRHPPRGSLVRFRGRVAPGHDGLRVRIQWLGPHGRWHAIRRTRLRAAGGGVSFYSVRVRSERSGRYRVVVGPDAGHAAGLSRTIRIRGH